MSELFGQWETQAKQGFSTYTFQSVKLISSDVIHSLVVEVMTDKSKAGKCFLQESWYHFSNQKD